MVYTGIAALMTIVSLAHAVGPTDLDGPGYISFPLASRTHPNLIGKHAKR